MEVRNEKSLSTDDVDEHEERGLISSIVGSIGDELDVELLLARLQSLLHSSVFGGRGGGTSSFGSGSGARISSTRSSSKADSSGGKTRSTGTPSPRSLQTRAIFSLRSAIGDGMVKLGSYNESQSESRVYVEDRASFDSFWGRRCGTGGVLYVPSWAGASAAEKERERFRVETGGSDAGRRRVPRAATERGYSSGSARSFVLFERLCSLCPVYTDNEGWPFLRGIGRDTFIGPAR